MTRNSKNHLLLNSKTQTCREVLENTTTPHPTTCRFQALNYFKKLLGSKRRNQFKTVAPSTNPFRRINISPPSGRMVPTCSSKFSTVSRAILRTNVSFDSKDYIPVTNSDVARLSAPTKCTVWVTTRVI